MGNGKSKQKGKEVDNIFNVVNIPQTTRNDDIISPSNANVSTLKRKGLIQSKWEIRDLTKKEKALINENGTLFNNGHYCVSIFIETHVRTRKVISYFVRELVYNEYDLYVPNEISNILFKFLQTDDSLICIGTVMISRYMGSKQLLYLKQLLCNKFPNQISWNSELLRLRTVINDTTLGRVFFDNKKFKDNMHKFFGFKKFYTQICCQQIPNKEIFTSNKILLNVGKCKIGKHGVLIYPFDEVSTNKNAKILGGFRKKLIKLNRNVYGSTNKNIIMACITMKDYLYLRSLDKYQKRSYVNKRLHWTMNVHNNDIIYSDSVYNGHWRARSGDVILFQESK